jgi:hypothetical protein
MDRKFQSPVCNNMLTKWASMLSEFYFIFGANQWSVTLKRVFLCFPHSLQKMLRLHILLDHESFLSYPTH